MRLLELSLGAFGPFKDEQLIDFSQINERKLFLVTGPTGAGKTSIFDAISYALFGQSSGNGRDGDSFRSDFASLDDETYVSLSFEIKGIQYKIRRSPKQERKKVKGDGITVKQPEAIFEIKNGKTYAGVKDVNDKIQEILGINHNQFKQIVMLPQGEFRQLLEANSRDREAIFRKIFKTEDFLAIQERLKEKTKDLDKEIGDVYQLLNNHISHIMSQNHPELQASILSDYKDYHKIIQLLYEKNNDDEKILNKISQDISIMEQQIFKLEKEINDANMLNQKFENLRYIKQQKTKLLEENEEIQHLENKVKLAHYAQIIFQIDEQLEQLNNTLVKTKNDQTLACEHKENLNGLIGQLKQELLKKQQDMEEIKIFNDKVYSLKEKLKKLQIYEGKTKQLTVVSNQVLEEKKRLDEENNEIIKLNDTIKSLENNLILYQEIDIKLSQLKIEKEKMVRLIKDQQLLLKLMQDIQNLTEEHLNLSEIYQKRRDEYQAKKNIYENKVEIYRMNQAGILAQTLEAQKPCPVCGSLDHPHKAEILEDVLSIDELDELKLSLENEEQNVNMSYSEVLSKNQSIIEKKDLYESLTTEKEEFDALKKIKEIKSDIETNKKMELEIDKQMIDFMEKIKIKQETEQLISQTKKQYEEKIVRYQSLEEKYQRLNQDYLVQLESIKEYDEMVKDYPNKDIINKELSDIENKISQISKEYEKHLEKVQAKENERLVIETNIENLKNHETELIHSIEIEKIKLNDKLKAYQMEETNYKNYLYQVEELNAMEKKIKYYAEELSYLDKTIFQLNEELKDKTIINIDEIIEKQEELKSENEKQRQLEKEYHLLLQNNTKLVNDMNRLFTKVKTKIERFEVLSDLSKAANGDNPQKLTFERYVLAAYFDEIIYAANLRLSDMTGSRYYLCRKEEKGKGASQQGLDLEVVDNYTSKNRLVKTLSGGEAFIASLALALGLADVVQGYSGGIQLDTIFIDEGFGSLDPDSLDHAITTLTNIQKTGRLVGIISHVQELKERIDVKLEITPSKNGSHAQFNY